MGALLNLISRLSGSKQEEAKPERVRRISDRVPRVSDRVPIIVRRDFDDDEPEEPTIGGGATVRNIRWEPGAELDAPPSSGLRFVVSAAGKTDPGLHRASNEDALLVMNESTVYVVADGMGGHAGGGVASQLAIEAIATAFVDTETPRAETPSVPNALAHVPARAAELVQSFAAANDAIRSAASKDVRLADMGTTVVAARFCADERRVYVAHVGDSRCYRLRAGKLERITRDHTMAELGMTGRESRHLSRAVGPMGVVEADVAVLEPRAGDVYMLCTDGLTKMVPDDVIRDVLVAEQGAAGAAAMLVARANEAGGRDNVTAVVIRVAAARA
jgi:PPM family protein phosphatase